MPQHEYVTVPGFALLVILVFRPLPLHPQSKLREPTLGVVVESLNESSEGLRAGLQVGDVITSWTSDTDHHGYIQSLFDWDELLVERDAFRGEVKLHGQHESQERCWTLARTDWGIAARPDFRSVMARQYLLARGFERLGEGQKALAAWQKLGFLLDDSDPLWLRPWLLVQTARAISKVDAARPVNGLYNKALIQSEGVSLDISLQILDAWGAACRRRGDLSKAETVLQKALSMSEREKPDSLRAASCLSHLANVYYDRGDLSHAETLDQRAIEITRRLAPDSLSFADSMHDLGTTIQDRGDLARAQNCYLTALAIKEKLSPGSSSIARTLNNLGVIGTLRGDLVRAELYLNKAKLIFESQPQETSIVATITSNLSEVYRLRGDALRAEKLGLGALALRTKISPGSLDVAASLNNLGIIYLDSGNLAKAEEYERLALAIRERKAPGSLGVATAFDNLGSIASQRNLIKAAESYYLAALALTDKIAPDSLDVAVPAHALGVILEQKGLLDGANRKLRQALEIREKLEPESEELADTLHHLASVSLRTKRFQKALHYFGRAIDCLEAQASRLGGAEAIRSAFRAKYASCYRDYIEALITRNETDSAFHVLERFRAQSLLHMMAERDLLFANDVPQELQSERKLNAAEYDQVQSDLGQLGAAKDAPKRKQSLLKLQELAARREDIADDIKRASPHFASLQYPQPLEVATTREILDPGTLLLSFCVSGTHVTVFAILPKRQDPGLTTFRLPVQEDALRVKVNDFRSLIEKGRGMTDADLLAQGRELYDLLLRPMEALIGSSERVLIIPDGPLETLPFAALIRGHEFLAEWKPLHSVVSSTVYAELKRGRSSASDEREAELVAFGDPIYSENGEGNKLDLPLDGRSQSDLIPLPFSREEVDIIGALFRNRSQVYLGPDATEERAKALGTSVRYVHFAVHGILDERFPLNSALVLTIPSEAEGHENGFLQAWEVFEQMKLEADLVTLSACNTALGQELAGEGMIGLTRAFQYAGAHSVLASLWSVNDRWTMELMKHFYTDLKHGEPKDKALQDAQRELIHSRGGSKPIYWAAFSLNGDWK